MGRLRSKLSYANVISTLCLSLLLGGGAYAATQLPKNSVGTKQIKPNAVNSSKIANGSLLTEDFNPRQLPVGPQGPPGPKGDRGDMGSPGVDGAAIAARFNSTADVNTPTNGSFITIPLNSTTWTQAAGEIDLWPFGTLTYTAPGPESCGETSFASLTVEFLLEVKFWKSWRLDTLLDGLTHTASGVGDFGTLFEPSAPATHTVTVKASGLCDSGPFPISFAVSNLRFDVIRAR